ncbi:MAG: glycosyltransferase [Candidatus Pacebacteria bacterium]|nr:glycosyltransferase [Candidatus Paceibacterota bacterium]
MRIAFFTDNFYPEISGITDTVLITARELEKRGHSVAFIYPRYAKKDYEKAGLPSEKDNPTLAGFEFHRIPSVALPGSPTGQSRIAIPFGHSLPFIKRFAPDVIHTHSPFGVGIEALLVAKILRVPLIGTNHTPIEEFMAYGPVNGPFVVRCAQKYFSWYYNRCRFITAPSNGLLENMKKSGFKAPCFALANPVSLNLFRQPEKGEKERLKKVFDLPEKVIIYAGRLAPEKHIDVTIRAVQRLVATIPNILLVLTGHGSAGESLKKLTRELGLEKNVRFTGFLTLPKLAEYYRASDIFVIMSTAETQSLALMQAFATGLPSIGASAHGLKEYLKPECGYQIEPNDDEVLAEKIKFLFENNEVAKRMGEAGIAYTHELAPSKIADAWEEIFRKGIEEYSTRRQNKQPSSSLVICAHNEEKHIGVCLEHVKKNSKDRFFEIIVIDNASTDRTKDIAEGFPGVRVVYEKRKGLTRARQRGFEEAKGDIIAYIDADTKMSAGWIESALREFEKNANLASLSGPYIYYDLPMWQRTLVSLWWMILAYPAYLFTRYMLVGGNFVIRREVLEKMGGFDTSIEFYGEDTDIARRAYKFGKVKFKPSFAMHTSGRRLTHHGIIKTAKLYVSNFLSEAVLHRPVTKEYKDVR